MRKHPNLAVMATVSMLALSVSCSDRYQEGFDAGKKQGYQEGYDAGDTEGFERARDYFASAEYNDGYNDGKTAGIAIGQTAGYNTGYSAGKSDGYTQGYNVGKSDGYNQGYRIGKEDGFDLGFDDGYQDGKTFGYNQGLTAGRSLGFDEGFDDGFIEGRKVGYEEGWDQGWEDALDAYGLSVGKTQSLRGYANILSMAHNDIFDYSKIAAPVETKRGVLVNGQLLMSEISLTNKDTLKRAAVVEQYLVGEMAKQVKAKFGLSAERSLKIAKASNHFRKISSKRAISVEETGAYAEEFIGVDMATLEKGVSEAKKGDLSILKSAMETAAEKNETTPEKMLEILTKHFI